MSDEASPFAMPPGIEGVVDRYAGGIVSGWACHTGPSHLADLACSIEVVAPGGRFGRGVADLYRADLEAAGKRQGLCAFDVMLGEHDETLEIPSIAVVVAGFPHRLPPPPVATVAPVRDWLHRSGDPLAQDLVVHRCHLALTGLPAPAELLALARPALPLSAASVCATLALVAEQVNGLPPARVREDATRTVQNVYRGVLRREPGPLELEMHGDTLLAGTPVSDIIAELLLRPEFIETARLQPVPPPGDGGAAEMHRLGEVLEKAMLTLAVSAAIAPGRTG